MDLKVSVLFKAEKYREIRLVNCKNSWRKSTSLPLITLFVKTGCSISLREWENLLQLRLTLTKSRSPRAFQVFLPFLWFVGQIWTPLGKVLISQIFWEWERGARNHLHLYLCGIFWKATLLPTLCKKVFEGRTSPMTWGSLIASARVSVRRGQAKTDVRQQ